MYESGARHGGSSGANILIQFESVGNQEKRKLFNLRAFGLRANINCLSLHFVTGVTRASLTCR